MARHPVIPPKYHDEVVLLSSEGNNADKICAILKERYDIDSNLNMVYQIIRNKKKERQEATQKIYAEAAAKSAYKDLDIIDAAIEKLNKEYQESFAAGNKKEAAELLNTMIKFQSKRMDLSGLGKESADMEDSIDEAKEDLMKRLSN